MQVPQLLAVLTAPPARWPMPWHVAGALACVGLVLALAATDHAYRRQRHTNAMDQLHAARLQAAHAQRTAQALRPEPAPPLAAAAAVQAMLQDLAVLATAQGVRIASVRLDHDHAPGRAHRVVLVALQVHASYLNIKTWLGDLQDRNPALAIAALSLRRSARDAGQVEADLTLSLYLRVTP